MFLTIGTQKLTLYSLLEKCFKHTHTSVGVAWVAKKLMAYSIEKSSLEITRSFGEEKMFPSLFFQVKNIVGQK
jgi:hypothetical protein